MKEIFGVVYVLWYSTRTIKVLEKSMERKLDSEESASYDKESVQVKFKMLGSSHCPSRSSRKVGN